MQSKKNESTHEDFGKPIAMESELQEAEEAMSAHEATLRAPSLSEAERQAMRNFCLQSLRLKQEQEKFKAKRKESFSSVKTHRAALQEWIRAQHGKCFVMPRSKFRDAEQELSGGGLPPVPPYLRVQRNTSDSAITPTVAESSIMDLDDRAVLDRVDQGANPIKALCDAIVDSARSSVRSVKEAVALSESIEKGLKPMEVEEVPEDIAQLMVEMHKAQQKTKAQGAVQREATSDVSAALKKLQPTVSTVLDKTGRNSQQVTLDGVQGRHRIVKRTTTRAPKVTLTLFEDAVSKSVASLLLPTTDAGAMLTAFRAQRKHLVRDVQLKLNSLPKKESSKVSLVSINDSRGGEESDDEETND